MQLDSAAATAAAATAAAAQSLQKTSPVSRSVVFTSSLPNSEQLSNKSLIKASFSDNAINGVNESQELNDDEFDDIQAKKGSGNKFMSVLKPKKSMKYNPLVNRIDVLAA